MYIQVNDIYHKIYNDLKAQIEHKVKSGSKSADTS